MTLFTFLVPLSVTRTKGHPIRRITSFWTLAIKNNGKEVKSTGRRSCGPHTIDRFATIKTTKCKRYNSRYPGCCGVDALHQSDWAREMSFVNAPLRPLDSVLIIILHQEAEATIIAPARKAKNWFQKLRKLSIASPIRQQHAHTFCIQRGLRPPEALKKL